MRFVVVTGVLNLVSIKHMNDLVNDNAAFVLGIIKQSNAAR
jgi:hypothetical protein